MAAVAARAGGAPASGTLRLGGREVDVRSPRAALGSGSCDRTDDRYHLVPHMDTLLLDETSPALVGPTMTLLEQPEMFDRFEASLETGDRTWWDEASPEFIDNVADSGQTFYLRLVPNGLRQIPGLEERLAQPCRILDTACGAGVGVIRLARTYPDATVVGADGDAHSIDIARRRVEDAGLDDRISFVHSPLETSTSTASSPWSPTTSQCTSVATSMRSPPTSMRRWSPAAGSSSPTCRSPRPPTVCKPCQVAS